MPHCLGSHNINNFENYCYRDKEVERFFRNDVSFDQQPIEPSSPQQLNSFLHTEEVAVSQSKVLEELKTCYSDTWYLLQRQKIDFTEQNINDIFAAESGADGAKQYFFFRNSLLDCLSKTYLMLGQLTAL